MPRVPGLRGFCSETSERLCYDNRLPCFLPHRRLRTQATRN